MLTGWRWSASETHPASPAVWRDALWVGTAVFAAKLGLGSIGFDFTSMARDPWTFGFEVGHIAGNLATGHGFSVSRQPGVFVPTAWVSPLYPILLAGLFKVFGLYTLAAAKAMLAINCLFQGATAALLCLLGARLCNRTVGLTAAGVFFLNPNSWQFLAWAWPSHLFAFALLVHFATMLLSARGAQARGAAIGGSFALALMADGAAVAVAPVTLAHFYFGMPKGDRRPAILAAAMCFTLGVAPWTMRNAMHFGSVNPLRGNVGVNLWVGNHPGANAESFHGLAPSPWHDAEQGERFTLLGEHAYDGESRDRALSEIFDNPWRFVRNTFTRFTGFWIGEWWTGYGHIGWLYSMGLIVLSAAALRGAVYARSTGTGLLLVTLFFFGGPYYLTVHGHGRYRVPVEPLMCLLAAMRPESERKTCEETVEA